MNRRTFITAAATALLSPTLAAKSVCQKYSCVTPPHINRKTVELKKLYTYSPERRTKDEWRILEGVREGKRVYGDCEDFALTALMCLCDWNEEVFWKRLYNRQSNMYLCSAPNAAGEYGYHAILQYNPTWWIDSGTPRALQPLDYYIRKGYVLYKADSWKKIRNKLTKPLPKKERKKERKRINNFVRN